MSGVDRNLVLVVLAFMGITDADAPYKLSSWEATFHKGVILLAVQHLLIEVAFEISSLYKNIRLQFFHP